MSMPGLTKGVHPVCDCEKHGIGRGYYRLNWEYTPLGVREWSLDCLKCQEAGEAVAFDFEDGASANDGN